MNKTAILKIVSLCLVCFIIGGFVVYASTPNEIQTFSGGIHAGATTYTIYNVDGTVYCKDQNGVVDYSGTDDTTVINDCLDDGIEGVYKFVGDFSLDGDIQPLDGQTLDLYDARLDQTKADLPHNDVIWIGSVSDVKVLGGVFTGGYSAVESAQSTTDHGADKPNNIVIRDITVEYTDVHDGIHIANSSNVIIENCIIKNTIETGIRILTYSENVTINGNLIENTGEHGIRVYETTSYVTITGNVIRNSYTNGISAEAYHVEVIGNVMFNCATSGSNIVLTVSGNDYTSCVGNSIYGAPYFGITCGSNSICSSNLIRDCGYGINVIENCTVTGNSIYEVTYYGIEVTGPNNVLTGNRVDSGSRGIKIDSGADFNVITGGAYIDQSWGIQIDSGCDNNVVVGCSTRYCTNGIIDSGTDNQINLCWNITTWIP
jgi:parallel beta-helix repeat protein